MSARLAWLGQRAWMALWLAAVWVALWGELTPGNVVAGVVVAAAVLVAFPALAPGGIGTLRVWKVVRFGGYFLYLLAQANLIVAWQVIRPRARVAEGIVAVRVSGASDAILTLVANAITLTPGTLTLEIRREPPTLYVHVLQLASPEQTRREVRELERYAVEAFGSADAVAAVERRHTEEELGT